MLDYGKRQLHCCQEKGRGGREDRDGRARVGDRTLAALPRNSASGSRMSARFIGSVPHAFCTSGSLPSALAPTHLYGVMVSGPLLSRKWLAGNICS